MKTHPMGAELFHADGRTDGHGEANCRFLQFCGSAYMQTLCLFMLTLRVRYLYRSTDTCIQA
jgi:hypothetical protein